jgi:pilus assembly protein CpaB
MNMAFKGPKIPPVDKIKTRVNTNMLMLVLSVILGAAAVYFSRSFIEEQVDYYKTQLEKTEPMVQIVVPARDLLQGDVITEGDLAVREVPARYAHDNALTSDTYISAVGQRMRTGLAEGKALLWAHLEGGETATFSDSLIEGNRALTVPVDEINSISGFLQPRDNIDLFLTDRRGKEKAIYPIMQNLHVLATGVKTEVDVTGKPTGRTYNTITVQVTPENAKRIVLAQSVGKLTATLRNPGDKAMITTKALTASDLRGVKPEPKPQPRRRGIEYIIGGGN